MKRITMLFAVMLCLASYISMAGNNGNNGTNTVTTEVKASSEIACTDNAVDPYATSLDAMNPGPGCRGPKNPDLICTAQYDPVCGCDGKTYSNACVAAREGVLIYTPGECGSQQATSCFDPSVIDPSRICFAVYAPVCACGVLTFPNACEASRLGFVNTTPGACVTAPAPGQ